MSSPKINTGIQLLDEGVNRALDPTKAVKDTQNLFSGKTFEDAGRIFQDQAKNMEQGYQRQLQGWGQILGGKWNNIGHTLLAGPGDVSGLINKDAMDSVVGESAVARYTREATEKDAADTVKADLAATTTKVNEASRAFSAQIEGMAAATKRSPGRSQTLIGNKAGGNTLLTLKGKT